MPRNGSFDLVSQVKKKFSLKNYLEAQRSRKATLEMDIYSFVDKLESYH